jgi:hypothetical protein
MTRVKDSLYLNVEEEALAHNSNLATPHPEDVTPAVTGIEI